MREYHSVEYLSIATRATPITHNTNDNTVDWEIFAFKYFRVINVRVSNFYHKVQEVKIIHGVFYFRVLNFRRPRERRKKF